MRRRVVVVVMWGSLLGGSPVWAQSVASPQPLSKDQLELQYVKQVAEGCWKDIAGIYEQLLASQREKAALQAKLDELTKAGNKEK